MAKTKEEQEEQEEQEIIPVGDGVDEKAEDREDEDKEKEKEKEDELEDEEEEEEQRLGASEDDEEDGGKKVKRKTERKTRRNRQKAARERDGREMSFLRQRNETLERRFSEVEQRVGVSEVVGIDNKINDVKSQIKLADQVIAKAVSSQDGEAYAEAQGIRDDLRDNLGQLNGVKNYHAQRTRQAQQPQVNPQLIGLASDWMQDHQWWDPNGRDEDSRVVSRIDNALVLQGYDPTTVEYWDELRDRVAEELPHRSANGEERGSKKKAKKKPSGPTMRAGGRERPLKKNEVYISPERKEAMVQAGVWDDPEQRQKYLKSYVKYDAEARANQ